MHNTHLLLPKLRHQDVLRLVCWRKERDVDDVGQSAGVVEGREEGDLAKLARLATEHVAISMKTSAWITPPLPIIHVSPAHRITNA